MTLFPVIRNGGIAVCAGFLTRPCCVVPAALSLAGVGTAGASSILIAHRTTFMFLSATTMGTSLWMTFTREGGWANKTLALVAAVVAFSLSAGWTGLF
jgi:hypothetical protein